MSATSRPAHSVPLGERAALRITEACEYAGIGRTKLYQLLEAQKLRSAKIGARRLVLRESLDKLLSDTNA